MTAPRNEPAACLGRIVEQSCSSEALGQSLTTHHVMDAYLTGLAEYHGGKLLTLDQPLVKLFPKQAILIS